MQCLRCKTEMKHYDLNPQINIFGKEHRPNAFSLKNQQPHHIHSVYICDSCGYVEFSTKICENPDI